MTAPTTEYVKSDLKSMFSYRMRTDGYFVLQGAVGDPLLDSLRNDIDSAIEKDKARLKDAYTDKRYYDIVHMLFDKGNSFLKLLDSFDQAGLVDSILGDTCVLHSYNAVKLMPGRGNNATNVHRDSSRFSGDYILMLQALIMVDDFTLENGATYILPGSHHAPQRPTDDQFFDRAVRLTGKGGDAVFFDSLVWHAGGANNSFSPRRGITLVYSKSFMKQQIDFPKALTSDLIARMSERTKRLTGMNVRVPTSLEEFFLPEDQRTYKPGQG